MTAVDDVRHLVREVVRPAIHPQHRPLTVTAWTVHGEPVPADQAVTETFVPFAIGDRWGGRWDTTWFRMQAEIPREWAGSEVVALVHLGGEDMVGFTAEGLIWDSHLRPVQGFHHEHREYVVAAPAGGGEVVEFYVEAAANPIPPWRRPDWYPMTADYDGPPLYVLDRAELAVVDREVEALDLDLRILRQLAKEIPERTEEIDATVVAALAVVDPDDVAGTAAAARAMLVPALAARSSSAHMIRAVGHAHIDSAWLWPLRETRRKCARSFANQLRLMERYPEHHFVCSQAVQYQWIKDGYPSIYDEIKQRVAEGRWEPVGGMWVEPDSNVPSGESLVRQLVYGKRFFADEFGIETHELWIPDVFGYSAALPQIANQAGVTALITQKMSWNDTNAFPHSTFWWEGHDGSRVLAHFPPANTYNGNFSVTELAASQRNYRDHERIDRSLYPYGYGDGGGGPSPTMMEAARRLADVAGLPPIEIGPLGSWLDQVRSEQHDLATWVGELYLEAHRATLTTHADVKVGNRRAEESLRGAEMWCVAAGLDRRTELEQAWKTLLLQQFHDILPGSSIGWVYEDAAVDFAAVRAAAQAVIDEAHGLLGGGVFNPSSYDRREILEVEPGRLERVAVPACGWAPLRPVDADGAVDIGDGWMDNGLLRVHWDTDGLLTSIWDHQAGREVLAEGRRGNLFQWHEDHPRHFDAWDVDREYLDHVTDLVAVESIDVVERDPLRAGVRIARCFGDSRLEQTIRLAAGSRRIEFHTEVDWQDRHRFLKVAFPVAVRSTRATYEIQHGHIERPTVENTSWDTARFEVCGHRWADLSESGYGVALLNDCKYGYDIRGDVLRLSLLRGPGYPDPEADRGSHRFAYALLPHQGDLLEVVREAECFNLPLTLVPGDGPGGQVVTVDRPGVSVEAVKWADRRDGVIVRLCEVSGGRGRVRVTLHRPFERVHRTDLLERDLAEVEHDGPTVQLSLRPFELVTLLFS